jgi:glutathione S-transferase
MLTVFGLAKTWDFPDASPYVCKLVMWLRLAGIDYDLQYVPWPDMIEKAPRKSVPWIEDTDGEVIHDSARIIDRLTEKYSIQLDAHLSDVENAQMRAWQRLLEDHYYWAALVYMRWVDDNNWPAYKGELAADLEATPEIDAFFEEIRTYLVGEFTGHAVGKMSDEEVVKVAAEDLDALSVQLGDRPYFMGDRPTTVDAILYAYLLQTFVTRCVSPTVDYARKKVNLKAYFDRLHAEFWPD